MATKKIKKAINFDLDDKALKAAYPKPSYKHAWDDIKKFMLANGFTHRQYSGYSSAEPMTQAKVYTLIRKMKKALPWLMEGGVIQQIDVTDIGESYSLKYMFEQNAARKRKPQRKAFRKIRTILKNTLLMQKEPFTALFLCPIIPL